MSDDQDQPRPEPEERALSGSPDRPPQQAGHTPANDRELLGKVKEEEEEAHSAKPARDGEGGSDEPGTTLPGYG